MKNLTIEDLIKIHDKLVAASGEELDILSNHKLGEIIENHEKAKTLFKKAAILLHDIPHLQPFSEGNKRTAFSSFKIFVKLNELKIELSNDDLEDIIIKSVNDNITLNGVEKWLRKVKCQERSL